MFDASKLSQLQQMFVMLSYGATGQNHLIQMSLK